MIYGKVIEKTRKQMKLTRREFGEKLDITTHYVFSIERGGIQPSRQLLEKIANISGIPLSFIIWQATEEIDVPESKRCAYNKIKNQLDDLINCILENKDDSDINQ